VNKVTRDPGAVLVGQVDAERAPGRDGGKGATQRVRLRVSEAQRAKNTVRVTGDQAPSTDFDRVQLRPPVVGCIDTVDGDAYLASFLSRAAWMPSSAGHVNSKSTTRRLDSDHMTISGRSAVA
jgi:hypothetical protein